MTKKSERELVEAIRDDLRKAEAMLERAVRNGKLVVGLNDEADKANAAFKATAKINGALAGLQLAHAEATEILLANWPGFAGPVILGGGGR